MTAFLLLCFAAPIVLVWALCWRYLFGRDFESDAPSMAMASGVAILLSVYPVGVGWLACIIYRTGTEAWPFVLVTWTGILAGGLAARAGDAKRLFTALKVMREHDAEVSRKVQELGLGPQGRHDYEPWSFTPEGYRPELHALWWLRGHDSHLPKVTVLGEEPFRVLDVEGVPTLNIREGQVYVPEGLELSPLRLLSALLWVYDDTAREHQRIEHNERQARRRKQREPEGDEADHG